LRRPARRRVLSALAFAALVLYFLWSGVEMLDETRGVLALPFDRDVPYLDGSDFPAFYAGSRLFLNDPHSAYEPETQREAILQARGYAPGWQDPGEQWLRYYNPPAYSLLLAPLTLLELRAAFALTLLLNAAGLALLLLVLNRILSRRRLILALLALATITSVPVNYAFWHAQPTLFLATLAGLTYIALDSGGGVRSGLYWGLLAFKPHWLLAPATAAISRRARVLRPLLLTLVALATPFLLVGVDGCIDYLRLLLGRGQGDVVDANYSEAVLSWPGFFRGITGEPSSFGWLAMSALSLALVGLVLRFGRRSALPLASTLALLLVLPHSHPQDWVLIVPAAAIALRDESNALRLAITALLLVILHRALQEWSGLAVRDQAVYWPTLAAFALLTLLVLAGSAREWRAPARVQWAAPE
jgi:hypothetical protein